MGSGSNSKLQFAFESVYGTVPAMTNQFSIISESFKWTPERKDLGILTGGKGMGKSYITSVKSEGGFSTIVRPKEIGFWNTLIFGKEANPVLVDTATATYRHDFTCVDSGSKLKSASFTVKRDTEVKAYNGVVVSSVKLSAAPGDPLKIDFTFQGKDEVAGTLAGSLVSDNSDPFRFSHAKLKVEDVEVAHVTKIDMSINENISSEQTTSTGLYLSEPEVNARDITIDAECFFGADAATIRETYFKTDTEFYVDIVFTHDSKTEDDIPYSLTFTIPKMQMPSGDRNIGGPDRIKMQFTFKAVDLGTSDELIIASLVDDRATKYLA